LVLILHDLCPFSALGLTDKALVADPASHIIVMKQSYFI